MFICVKQVKIYLLANRFISERQPTKANKSTFEVFSSRVKQQIHQLKTMFLFDRTVSRNITFLKIVYDSMTFNLFVLFCCYFPFLSISLKQAKCVRTIRSINIHVYERWIFRTTKKSPLNKIDFTESVDAFNQLYNYRFIITNSLTLKENT